MDWRFKVAMDRQVKPTKFVAPAPAFQELGAEVTKRERVED
jgi:hypothetical protein